MNNLQCQVGVTQLDHRLTFLNHIAGLDEDAVHASAIDGIYVHCFAGHDARVQRDEIVEHATLDRRKSHLL